MSYFEESRTLTHAATLKLLSAAAAKADEMGQPQCIVVVDASGEVLGELRMSGAKFLSRKSALAKAQTAASIRNASANVPEHMKKPLSAATGGKITALPGGLPITKDGFHLGGIGIGSGTSEQDVIVATAALEAIGADT